jgi:hypothetical protein
MRSSNIINCFFLCTIASSFVLARSQTRNQSEMHVVDYIPTPAHIPASTTDLTPFPTAGKFSKVHSSCCVGQCAPLQDKRGSTVDADKHQPSFISKLGLSLAAGLAIAFGIVSAVQPIVKPENPRRDETPNELISASVSLKPRNAHRGAAAPKEPHKYKTQLCIHYQEGNISMCKYGVRCIFAHSLAELRKPSFVKPRSVPSPFPDAGTQTAPTRLPSRKSSLDSQGPVGPDGSPGFDSYHCVGRRAQKQLKPVKSAWKSPEHEALTHAYSSTKNIIEA